MLESFSALDIVIIFCSLIIVVLVGLLSGRKNSQETDFYFGSRRAPFWAVGLSVFASYSSSLSLLGAPGWSYKDGVVTLLLQTNFPLVALIVSVVFVPLFSLQKGSILELIVSIGGHMAGGEIAMFLIGLFVPFVNQRGIVIGAVLAAITSITVGLYTDISWPWYCLIGSLVTFVISILKS